ncbi:MAG: DUF998 domain-containing protein [Saprospiraceae bacterium]
MKEKYPLNLVFITLISCLLACVGDFVVTFILGYYYEGYNFIEQSQSILGTSGSPVANYMNSWGIIFSFLFAVYAFCLRRTIFKYSKLQFIASCLVALYGFGEGIGSGMFPFEKENNAFTGIGWLHLLFSALGDIGLVLFPILSLQIFKSSEYPRLRKLALFLSISGPILIGCFLMTKFNTLPYRGLWQRLFLLNYYILLMSIAIDMFITQIRLNTVMP